MYHDRYFTGAELRECIQRRGRWGVEWRLHASHLACYKWSEYQLDVKRNTLAIRLSGLAGYGLQ